MIYRDKALNLPYTYVPPPTKHRQTEMVGEVTQTSAILQARITKDGKVRWRDIPGATGVAAFALSTQADMNRAVRTEWQTVKPAQDHIVKVKVSGLQPNTRYYYALLSGADEKSVKAGQVCTFKTLAPKGVAQDASFVVVSCMNRFAFQVWPFELDKQDGFPILDTIRAQSPDFIVFTGDTVYYDSPMATRAKTQDEMRGKWHRQLSTERFGALFQTTATYWEKDDHDYRFNDADPHIPIEPSHDLGRDVFREQVPVVDTTDAESVTYRTHRINDLLQIWLLEGRDYRDSNSQIPGPTKTIWGETQVAWLKQTLLESDATFKVIISPTPLVGPDDAKVEVQGGLFAPLFGGEVQSTDTDFNKRDNHTNLLGFKQEGDAFFKWLVDNGFQQRNVVLVCGDRHWQYHSIHPDGFHEFSCGALTEANARKGRPPGDPDSTDPDGLIVQPYLQPNQSGGFLKVAVHPKTDDRSAVIEFDFLDKRSTVLYHTEYPAEE